LASGQLSAFEACAFGISQQNKKTMPLSQIISEPETICFIFRCESFAFIT